MASCSFKSPLLRCQRQRDSMAVFSTLYTVYHDCCTGFKTSILAWWKLVYLYDCIVKCLFWFNFRIKNFSSHVKEQMFKFASGLLPITNQIWTTTNKKPVWLTMQSAVRFNNVIVGSSISIKPNFIEMDHWQWWSECHFDHSFNIVNPFEIWS